MANALNKVNSGGIEDGSIVNADIKSDAAIAKSKLAALDLVNADINASAAIAKSKLASLDIVNADINASAAITYSKLQDVSATDRILGRDTSGAGDIEEITPANVRTMLNVEDGADVTDATNVNAAGAVMNSDLDGKGEILIGDGSGDPTALAVGTNDYVLTAASGEATGVKWAAAAGGGKLLQMVGNSTNNNTVISSTSFVTTNMSQTITPSKTGSKMLFMCAGHYSQNPNGGSWGPQVQVGIYKQIGSGTDTLYHQVTYDYVPVTTVYDSHHFAATIFDPTATLNTTDDIKYTIYAKLLYASHQMRFNPSGYTSLVIQEYDA